jgi:beta-lactamase regulating signal transducer with metallopeptidase domain/chaperonin cofactor prefoldin
MIEQANTLAHLWWDWMVSMTWQVSLLIVLVGCVDLLIRKWAWPQLRYALWSLILLKLILPPTLSLPSGVVPGLQPVVERAASYLASEQPLATAKGSAISNLKFQISDPSADTIAPSRVVYAESPKTADRQFAHAFVGTSEAANPQSEIPSPQLDWQVWALGCWLLGATVLGGSLIIRLRSLSMGHRETSGARPLPESFYNQLDHCASLVGLRRPPRVVPTTALTGPAVFGAFRPILLMPVGYLSKLSRRDTEHTLLHELAHIRRGDLLMHGLYIRLAILYWPNPLLWLVRRQVHHLRELCCDATVANLLREETSAYRRTLLETARRFLATHAEPGLGLLGLFEDSNRLVVRLNWLEKPTWRYRKMKTLIVTAVVASMAVCVLPMAQAQPTPVVQEENANTVTAQDRDQLAQDMQNLQRQMKQLEQQRQQFAVQMKELAKRMAELNLDRAELAKRAAGTGLFQSYTVKEGDTLAKIAEKVAGRDKGKIEDIIARIKEANELTDGIRTGQKLWVPARSDSFEKPGTEIGVVAPHARATVPHGVVVPPVTPHPPAEIDMPPVPRVAMQSISGHAEDLKATVEVTGSYVVKSLQPDTLVRVHNDVGSVTIRGGADNNCTVETKITVKADTEERANEIAQQVLDQVTPTDDMVLITTQIPQEVRDMDHKSIEVTFEITLPRHTRVQVDQKVGDVHLSALDAGAEVRLNVGSILAEDLRGNVDLSTHVGDVKVLVPDDVSTKVKAVTKMGSIESDLPLEVTNAAVLKAGKTKNALGSTASGTLGQGRDKLNVTSQVGSIKITSSPSAISDDGTP